MFGLVIAVLQTALPEAAVVQIPGVSHDLSNPPVVIDAIRGFLQRQSASG